MGGDVHWDVLVGGGEGEVVWPALRRGYKRSRPRRQLPLTPRSHAAIAESTEQNVTGAGIQSSRHVGVDMSRCGTSETRWTVRRAVVRGWDALQNGDAFRTVSCRTASGLIPF